MCSVVCRLLVKVTFLQLAFFFPEFIRLFYGFVDCHPFKLCTGLGNFFVGVPYLPLQGNPLLGGCRVFRKAFNVCILNRLA